MFFAADHVVLIDARPGAVGTPWSGDVHAEGNPHLHADPRNLLVVVERLAERLAREQPAQKAAIEQRRSAFEQDAPRQPGRRAGLAGCSADGWASGRAIAMFSLTVPLKRTGACGT